MEEEIKRLWKRVESISEDVYGSGTTGSVAVHLQRIADGLESVRTDLLGVKEEVRGVKDQIKIQNGSINKLTLDAAVAIGAAEEREKWERKVEEDRRDREGRRDRTFRNWMAAGFTGAGILSAIVLRLMDRL